MTYALPDGDFTLNIYLKTLSDSFYPRIYVACYDDLDSVISGLEFPPGGTGNYIVAKNWDRRLNIITYQ